MAMEARLTLRQTQRLVMTPMLQQAIQLLQLSTIELQELLQKELTENPMLEESPTEEGPAPEPAPEAPALEATPPDAPATTETPEVPELPFDLTEIMFGPPDERTLVQQEQHEETHFENFVGSTTSLADHLDEQLRLSVAEADVRLAGEEIIGNLDEDGYLKSELEEISRQAGVPLEQVETALAKVQAFDPTGVAARDLRECLLLQIEALEIEDPLLRTIVERHLEDVEQNRLPRIAKETGRELDEVKHAIDTLRSLEPAPGAGRGDARAAVITPEVVVEEVDGRWEVRLDRQRTPRLMLSPAYRELLKKAREGAGRRPVRSAPTDAGIATSSIAKLAALGSAFTVSGLKAEPMYPPPVYGAASPVSTTYGGNWFRQESSRLATEPYDG